MDSAHGLRYLHNYIKIAENLTQLSYNQLRPGSRLIEGLLFGFMQFGADELQNYVTLSLFKYVFHMNVHKKLFCTFDQLIRQKL